MDIAIISGLLFFVCWYLNFVANAHLEKAKLLQERKDAINKLKELLTPEIEVTETIIENLNGTKTAIPHFKTK